VALAAPESGPQPGGMTPAEISRSIAGHVNPQGIVNKASLK
jgi:hypothetical protein